MSKQKPRHPCERCRTKIQCGRYCTRCFSAVWDEEVAAGLLAAKQRGYLFTDEDEANGEPTRDAAISLRGLMRELSERCWCARWLIGCEYDLWHFASNGPGGWGAGDVTAQDVERLRALSVVSDGWWFWPDDSCDEPISTVSPVFVSMTEWRGLVARRGGANGSPELSRS